MNIWSNVHNITYFSFTFRSAKICLKSLNFNCYGAFDPISIFISRSFQPKWRNGSRQGSLQARDRIESLMCLVRRHGGTRRRCATVCTHTKRIALRVPIIVVCTTCLTIGIWNFAVASHLLRFAAKLCAPQIAVSRAERRRRECIARALRALARSIVDLSRGVASRIPTSLRKMSLLNVSLVASLRAATLCDDKVLTMRNRDPLEIKRDFSTKSFVNNPLSKLTLFWIYKKLQKFFLSINIYKLTSQSGQNCE